ncbi:hypothetical protein [Psychrobacter sp. FDAARGOS_221]|uniref:hypothetical protein n=1 Tax=Psychrobacter sp. FDAARGOS_221 TaxID=1975705 RepID=UPI000BB53564|nr:hypothetical protein [Psychrobacter sp. FDAARGOS_221]PNK60597.1 hypothetical protein A6J60_006735 [Psychrobacter sp. FDAARGOS_221]
MSTPSGQPHPTSAVNNHATNGEKKHAIAGFPLAAIDILRQAQKLNRLTIGSIVLAIFAFVVFGTLASLEMFHGSQQLYLLFHYLPYVLVALTIPLTLYQAFLVYRYRLSQPSMLVTSVGGASLLLIVCLLFSLSDWLWLAMAAWIGVAYWFQATFKRFFKFINDQQQAASHPTDTATDTSDQATGQ